MKKNRLFARIALTIAITAGFVAWMAAKDNQNVDINKENSSGKAQVGGAFALIDSHGKPFSSEHLKGKYSLVFFGFTTCPDMCPMGLTVMTEALRLMGEAAEPITPVFITIDPARDTPEVMAEYITHFHPRMVALTGEKPAIQQAIKAYKVYASKREVEEAADGYVMDHSGYLYLMDPNGAYITHFPHTIAPEALADQLQTAIAQH